MIMLMVIILFSSLVFSTEPVVENPSSSKALSVTVLKVQVESRKADGKAWDFPSGAPDPYVIVFDGAKAYQTSYRKDTYNAEFNKTFSFETNDLANIEVWDKDVDPDDIIGRTGVVLERGNVRLKAGQCIIWIRVE